MADDEDAPQCKVEYIDVPEPEETNWIKRAGKCKVVYPNGCTFEGMSFIYLFSSEKEDFCNNHGIKLSNNF
jgi:hypothetical protein